MSKSERKTAPSERAAMTLGRPSAHDGAALNVSCEALDVDDRQVPVRTLHAAVSPGEGKRCPPLDAPAMPERNLAVCDAMRSEGGQ